MGPRDIQGILNQPRNEVLGIFLEEAIDFNREESLIVEFFFTVCNVMTFINEECIFTTYRIKNISNLLEIFLAIFQFFFLILKYREILIKLRNLSKKRI